MRTKRQEQFDEIDLIDLKPGKLVHASVAERERDIRRKQMRDLRTRFPKIVDRIECGIRSYMRHTELPMGRQEQDDLIFEALSALYPDKEKSGKTAARTWTKQNSPSVGRHVEHIGHTVAQKWCRRFRRNGWLQLIQVNKDTGEEFMVTDALGKVTQHPALEESDNGWVKKQYLDMLPDIATILGADEYVWLIEHTDAGDFDTKADRRRRDRDLQKIRRHPSIAQKRDVKTRKRVK